MDPATKSTTGDYGTKYKGSIKSSESKITDDSGFKNIETIPPGYSPYAYINKVDDIRYEEGFRPK
jgi:hypothetical protein